MDQPAKASRVFVVETIAAKRVPESSILLALALSLPTARCSAGTVHVPPVTITQLTRCPDTSLFVCDAIFIPGPGYTSSGFSATLATDDVVIVRVEAPTGRKFAVASSGSLGRPFFFVFNMYWIAEGDVISQDDPHTFVFENFQGTMPTETYSAVAIGDNGRVVRISKQYEVREAFEFSAIQVEITVSRTLIPTPRTFSHVLSNSAPSWGASVTRSGTSATLMEIIESGPVPAQAASWGRLKSTYR